VDKTIQIIEKFRQQIKRKAIVLDIGGFRPPKSPVSSWFGKVLFCNPNEDWPMQDGEAMHALAQINIKEFPFKPRGLEDIEFICVFIGPKELPDDEPSGNNWQIRTYSDLTSLVLLQQYHTESKIKPFPMKPRIVNEDYPKWEDIPVDCPDEIEDRYYDLFENIPGFKFGGWPSLIQSEIYWAENNQHEANPEYVFQIDTTEKGNWMWGDHGVGYFGRGTTRGLENQWALSWQCY